MTVNVRTLSWKEGARPNRRYALYDITGALDTYNLSLDGQSLNGIEIIPRSVIINNVSGGNITIVIDGIQFSLANTTRFSHDLDENSRLLSILGGATINVIIGEHHGILQS